MIDPMKIREDFPMFVNKVTMQGQPIDWLDNASTTFKPYSVEKAVCSYYESHTSNSHRGDYDLCFQMDEKILEVNRQYLQHDYYTDIITFDYTSGDKISGDLFISLDTVRTNSEAFHTDYNEELHRTIIHGILHLCGINDKGPGEREIMEACENKALAILPDACRP